MEDGPRPRGKGADARDGREGHTTKCHVCGTEPPASAMSCPVCGTPLTGKSGGPNPSPKRPLAYVSSPADIRSPIVVIMASIVLAVLLTIVTWAYLAGTEDHDEAEHTTVNLTAPNIARVTRGGVVCWDVNFTINKISPMDMGIRWDEARILIKEPAGSDLWASRGMKEDTGLYDGSSPMALEAWYIETTHGGRSMTATDGIKLTGIGLEYEGAIIELTLRGFRIGTATLPTTFP